MLPLPRVTQNTEITETDQYQKEICDHTLVNTLALNQHMCHVVTRLVLTSTNCPKHTRLGETGRTWAKLRISAKVGDLDYDCDYEQ